VKYYRLMSSLPVLPSAPDRPTIPLAELATQLRVELSPADWRLAEGLLGRIDVANTVATGQGQDALWDARGLLAVEDLTARGAGADRPQFLEDFLQRKEEGGLASGSGYLYDSLWQAYYAALLELAEGAGGFLAAWLAWEIPLLNGLARQRSERLGREVEGALLPSPPAPVTHDELLARAAEESDPMARERLLDGARLTAIEALSGADPFSIDAVLAYLTSLLILDRWDLPAEADAQQLLEVFE